MKIGIDASRYLYGQATGVETYSNHIIDGIVPKILNRKDDVILYSKERLRFPHKVENRILEARRMWTLRALSSEMVSNPPDVLFVPSHVLPLKRPKRSVITIHDVAFKHLRRAYSLKQYHYLNWSTKYAVRHANKIIVPSKATAEDLERFYKCDPGKVAVIPHGFTPPEISEHSIEHVFDDSEIFKYFDVDRKADYLLFVGRLEEKKNLVNLVIAFSEFLKKFPNYRLILAGKRGVGFPSILRAVRNLGLSEKVIMPGYVTEAEKAALYMHCRAFVFPSQYEGFGFPVLEAFHFGAPVVCSNTSSLPEVADEAAHFVDPANTLSIEEGLTRVIGDEKYSKGLVELGHHQLEKFSWDKASEKTLNAIYG